MHRMSKQDLTAAATVECGHHVQASSGEVQVSLQLPGGYHFTPGANSRFEALVLDRGSGLQLSPASGRLAEDTAAGFRFRWAGAPQSAQGRVLAKAYFCQEEDVCLFQELSFELRFEPGGEGGVGLVVPLRHALRVQS